MYYYTYFCLHNRKEKKSSAADLTSCSDSSGVRELVMTHLPWLQETGRGGSSTGIWELRRKMGSHTGERPNCNEMTVLRLVQKWCLV